MVGGYDFAQVIEAYWYGHEQDNEILKNNAIKWLRAEYTTKPMPKTTWVCVLLSQTTLWTPKSYC